MCRIQTLVINLATSTDRLSDFAEQARRENIDFDRVDAIDMRGKPVSHADQVLATRHYGRPLLAGEIGCFHSHIMALEKFLTGSAEILLLFEDDAVLKPGFWALTRAIANDITHPAAPDWSMVCLGNASRRKYAKPLRDYAAAGTKTTLERALSYPILAHCQLVSRAGAQAFMQYKNRPIMPIDQVYARDITRSRSGFSVSDPIALQAGDGSDIDDRGVREGDPMGALMRKWPRKWRNRFDAELSKRQHRAIDAAWLSALDGERQSG